jgi:hemolysin III
MTAQTLQRNQTLGEEIANSVSHGVGFLGAVAVTPVLIFKSIPGGAASIVGASIFGGTMMILYLASTLYHSLHRTRARKLFQIFDHSAIFLLIAGTYTPFTLGVLRGAWGWSLFGIVWGLAIFGVLLKSLAGAHPGRLSTVLYLSMGWLALVAIRPLWVSMPASGLFWLFAGGLMYSAGVAFFVYDNKIPYGHFVWHLFVMGGTACHVVAVMAFAF